MTVVSAILLSWYAGRRPVRGALGEVRDYRHSRPLWRLEAARLTVRERKDGGEVRMLYRTSRATVRHSCPPAEARRIAAALREAARNPLLGSPT